MLRYYVISISSPLLYYLVQNRKPLEGVFICFKIDNLVKSLEIVMPDPVSGTGQARSGIQNVLNLLDSGLRRNDGEENFSSFYESINYGFHKQKFFSIVNPGFPLFSG